MQDWSLDIINSYCEAHFGGNFVCEVAEGKGRIMSARKAVPQGEVLFVEPPLHIVKEDEDNQAFIILKRLCEEEPDEFDYEPLWYWAALCSLTEEQLKKGPKVGSLPSVTPEQHRRLLCLYHEPVEEASDAVLCILKRLGLKVAPLVVEELLQAWILNCFEHSDDPPGYSAYFASSFVSHSCRANAIWTEADDGAHVLRARQDIAAGDEITISYLDEHVLLHSAAERKRVLKETKLFECTCVRCSAPNSAGEESVGADMCRGFNCKKCGECAVFHRLTMSGTGKGKGKGKGKSKGDGLRSVCCSACGVAVEVNEGTRLLQAEAALETKIRHLDEQVEKTNLGNVMDEDRARSLLKLVANGASGPVGPQHWLCDRLWEHLQKWYGLEGRREEQRRMIQLRVEYQRKAYPGLSAVFAWTLEQQADTLLRHLGFGSPMLASDRQFEDDMLVHVRPVFEDSKRILGLLFGMSNDFYTQVEKKHLLAQRFFEKRTQIKESERANGQTLLNES